MIASLHDKDRKITIPGFYDQVEVISDAERKDMAKAPFSLDHYKNELDIDDVYGEKDLVLWKETQLDQLWMLMEYGVVIQERELKQL